VLAASCRIVYLVEIVADYELQFFLLPIECFVGKIIRGGLELGNRGLGKVRLNQG
jgi:hypothetical protein